MILRFEAESLVQSTMIPSDELDQIFISIEVYKTRDRSIMSGNNHRYDDRQEDGEDPEEYYEGYSENEKVAQQNPLLTQVSEEKLLNMRNVSYDYPSDSLTIPPHLLRNTFALKNLVRYKSKIA